LAVSAKVDPLAQLVEGQPPGHEVLTQLDHGHHIALGIADPEVIVVSRPARARCHPGY